MADLVGANEYSPWAARGFSIAAVLLLGTINVAGVKWVIKLQFALLLIILLAALDFFVGSFTATPSKYNYNIIANFIYKIYLDLTTIYLCSPTPTTH